MKISIKSMFVFALFIQLFISSQTTALTLKQLLTEEREWAGLTTKQLTVKGVTWHYSEGGDASKPTVLLLHGMMGTKDNWNRVASFLTKDYHVIIPDLPMHGGTQVPADYDPQPAYIVESLGDFSRALKLKNIHIAGHSLGGSVAAYFSAKYFFNVQSVFLVNAAGIYDKANTRFLTNPDSINNMMITKKGDFGRVLPYVMHKPPFIPKQILSEQEDAMIALKDKHSRLIKRTIELAKLYKPGGYHLVLRAIEAPTLVLWGDKDRIINIEVTEELAENLKNEEPIVVLKNVGHTPILEAEQLVAMHYLPFLKKAQQWKSPFKNIQKTVNDSQTKKK